MIDIKEGEQSLSGIYINTHTYKTRSAILLNVTECNHPSYSDISNTEKEKEDKSLNLSVVMM